MKKVLFVATISRHIMSFHLPYIKELKEKGIEVHVASNNNEFNYNIPFIDQHFDIPFDRSPLSYKNILSYLLLKKIIKQDYDFIHCHTPIASVITRLLLNKKSNTKVIYTAHGFHFYKGAPKMNWLLYYPIEKVLSKRTDVIITINEEDFSISKNFKNDNIHLLNGIGVDSSRFFKIDKSEKINLKKNFKLDDNDIILFYAAELNKNKNQIILIEAMNELILKDPKIKLVLAGNGPLTDKLKKVVKNFKLENNVIFLGQVDNIDQWLKVSDLVLSSSKREGLPINLIEAMFSGVPAVVSNCRGNKDLVEHGLNGYVYNNSQELVTYINRIINNEELRNFMSKNALEKSKKYEIEVIKKDLFDIYNNAVN